MYMYYIYFYYYYTTTNTTTATSTTTTITIISNSLLNSIFLLFLLALLRQTNPNWKAFFLIQEESKQLYTTMLTMLNEYEDVRLNLLPETTQSVSS